MEVAPDTVAGMLGAAEPPGADVGNLTGRPGVAVGMVKSSLGDDLPFVEAAATPRQRPADPDRTPGRAHAGVRARRLRLAAGQRPSSRPRPGLASHVHLQVDSRRARNDAASAGTAMVAALVSASWDASRCASLAMTGATTLDGQVAAGPRPPRQDPRRHRSGLDRVVLPRRNRREIHEGLGHDHRRAVALDYVSHPQRIARPTRRTVPWSFARSRRRPLSTVSSPG